MANENTKPPSISETIDLVLSKLKSVKDGAKPGGAAHTVSSAVFALALVVKAQEERLQKFEERAQQIERDVRDARDAGYRGSR